MLLLHEMHGCHVSLSPLMLEPLNGGFIVVVGIIGRGRRRWLHREGRANDAKGGKRAWDPMESKSWHGLLQSARNKNIGIRYKADLTLGIVHTKTSRSSD